MGLREKKTEKREMSKHVFLLRCEDLFGFLFCKVFAIYHQTCTMFHLSELMSWARDLLIFPISADHFTVLFLKDHTSPSQKGHQELLRDDEVVLIVL